ncbi:MAG: hypothetical protein OEZ34_09890 [Spirochaetia bacterium]|nr:hypothetical protein [Spirochaetia bacterium]
MIPEKKFDLKYECRDGEVFFHNGIVISRQELDALFKIKALVTCSPSFLWMQFLRMKENEDSLSIRFTRSNFKRKQKALEILRDAGHYDLGIQEISENKKNMIQMNFTNIKPDFKSLIPCV